MKVLLKARNDILRQHGVIPPKPASPTPVIQEAIRAAQEQAHADRLESKDLDELDELEDVEDEAFLNRYRSVKVAHKPIPMVQSP